MERHNTTNIALFMIFLIILLPFHSSGVMAVTTINSIDSYGNDGIVGIRAQRDVTIVNVSVSSTDDSDISGNQVKIIEEMTRNFECAGVEGSVGLFNCMMDMPEMAVPENIGLLEFNVQVFSDAGNPLSASRHGSVLVDARPPKLLGPVDYSVLPGGVVVGNFRATDYACDKPVCNGLCAGIASVRFTIAGTVVGQETEFDDICDQTGTVNMTGVIVGGDVADKHICIEMADRLGQSSTECSDVFVDARAPEITSIGLYDSNNKLIDFTNGDPISNVQLKINITEHSGLVHPDDGSADKIKVNASALSDRPDQQAAYGDLDVSCTEVDTENNKYTCTVSNLFLIMSNPRTISVSVKANDTYENALNEQKTLSVGFDNTGPVAHAIRSSYVDEDGTFWVREDNNTIFVDVAESGSGLDNRYLFLDFTSFGTQDSPGSVAMLAPNSCEAGWTCQWDRIAVGGPSSGTLLTLAVQAGSKDDASNAFNSFAGSMLVDVDAPLVNDDTLAVSNITGIGELHEASTDLVGGDMIELHLIVLDHSGIKNAYANFSEVVVDGEEAAPGECTETGVIAAEARNKAWDCVWSAGPLLPGYLGPEDADDPAPSIYFRLEDLTDHIGEHEWKDIEILASENETGVSWEYELSDPSPELGLDRLTWTLSEPRIYYQLTLDGISSRDPIPLSVELDAQTCSGLEYVTVDEITNDVAISLLDFPIYSSRPEPPFTDIVEIRMNPSSVPELVTVDEEGKETPMEGFYINCSLYITSIVSTGDADSERAMTLPEELNVSFWVPVYNNPLGSNIGNVNDYVEKMIEDSKKWEWLTTLRQIFDVAEQVCHLIETLMRVNTIWSSIKDVFGGLCGAGHSCGTSAQVGNSEGFLSGTIGDFIEGLYEFCGLFISCRVTQPPPASCTGTWCSVQRTWGRITGFYGRIASMALLSQLASWTRVGDGASFFGGVSGGGSSGGEEDRAADRAADRTGGASDAPARTPSSTPGGTSPVAGSGGSTPAASGGSDFGTVGFEGGTGTGREEDQGETFDSSSFDPKKSIFASALSLCIPGLITNGEKFRQIHCKKILCYRIDVANGRPAWRCDQEYNYLVCTHLTGQAFAAIPIFQFIDEIGGMMEGIFRNPWGLLGWAVDKGCNLICSLATGVGCSVCRGILLVPAIISIGSDLVEGTGARFDMAMFDMCEEATAELPDYNNIEPPTPPTGII